MKRSTRLGIVLVVIEAGLAALWMWLLSGLRSGDLKPSGTAAEAAATVSSTIGGVMGALGGVLLVAIVVLRRKGN